MLKNNEKMVIFGRKLQEMRKKRGFSAYSIASAAQITAAQLSNYEHGKTCMNIKKIQIISEVMFLSYEEKNTLMELYLQAKDEAYKTFSKAAKKREQKKRESVDFVVKI